MVACSGSRQYALRAVLVATVVAVTALLLSTGATQATAFTGPVGVTGSPAFDYAGASHIYNVARNLTAPPGLADGRSAMLPRSAAHGFADARVPSGRIEAPRTPGDGQRRSGCAAH